MTNFAKELQQILKKNNKSAYKFSKECGIAPITLHQIIGNGNIPQYLTVQKICENVSPKERTKLLSAVALDRTTRKGKEKTRESVGKKGIDGLWKLLSETLVDQEDFIWNHFCKKINVPVETHRDLLRNIPPEKKYLDRILNGIHNKEKVKAIRDLISSERKEKIENGFPNSEPEKKFPNTAQFDLGDGKILTISLQFKIENTGKKGTL